MVQNILHCDSTELMLLPLPQETLQQILTVVP